MTTTKLQELIEAERRSGLGGDKVARGWNRLSDSLQSGVLPMADVPVVGPLEVSAGSITSTVAFKAVMASAVVGVVATGVVVVSNPAPPTSSGSGASSAPMAASVAPPEFQPAIGEADEPPSEAEESPRDPESDQISPPRSMVSPERLDPTEPASTFEAELTLIKRAKAALDGGRTRGALVHLDEHTRRFPAGVFAGEREALRALALCESGRRAQGRALAERFVALHSSSPLIDRVRHACGMSDGVPVRRATGKRQESREAGENVGGEASPRDTNGQSLRKER